MVCEKTGVASAIKTIALAISMLRVLMNCILQPSDSSVCASLGSSVRLAWDKHSMVGELCSWGVTPLLHFCEHAPNLLMCLPTCAYLTRPSVDSGKCKKPGFPVTGLHSQMRDDRVDAAICCGRAPFHKATRSAYWTTQPRHVVGVLALPSIPPRMEISGRGSVWSGGSFTPSHGEVNSPLQSQTGPLPHCQQLRKRQIGASGCS